VILANCASLAGHVTVEEYAIFGGLSAVHQFTRVGKHAFISGGTLIGMDIPPYCTATGNRAELAGLNTVGLKRHNFTDAQIDRIKSAYKIVFRSKMQLREALAHVKAEHGGNPEIDHFVRFIEGSERGITR
jgi:UDP-N-acetylglucosamine acyltransferase